MLPLILLALAYTISDFNKRLHALPISEDLVH